MTPLQIKLASYAAMALILTGLYFSWEHHIKSIQREIDRAEVARRDADTARQSAELMATEKAKVEKENDELNVRILNAVTIYAERSVTLNDDVDNLTKRLRNSSKTTSCSQNPVPGAGDDNIERERRNNEADNDIARAAIKLANLCEKKINELKVVN